MRIMILNHQSKRVGSPQYEARVAALLQSYASPGTTIEMHYPEDLGGSEVTSHLRKSQALAGLHHALETLCFAFRADKRSRGFGKRPDRKERLRVVQRLMLIR